MTHGLLRRLRLSDLAAFQTYRAIPELGRFQGWSRMTDAQAQAFLAEMADGPLFRPGDWIQLGISEANDDKLVGDVGIFLSADGSFAEIGFTLAPAAQGRGLATGAVRRAVQLVFEQTDSQQVTGITDSRNAPSIRVLERVGFRHESRRETVFRGEACTEEVFVLPRVR